MTQRLWDYHTHCYLNQHAKGTTEQYIISAVEKNLEEIGVSDHYPMQFLPEASGTWPYSMNLQRFPEYFEECKLLREIYSKNIKVKLATEVDYYEPSFKAYQKSLAPYLKEMDYIIGSVHVIHWPGVSPWGVDDEKFMALFKTYGTDKVFLEYYNAIENMVRTRFYNIIGHFDLPKKFGLLPQSSDIIWQKILRIFDEVERADMVIEINTSGFLKPIKEQYPAISIIEEIQRRKIPITLGSDAHDPVNVGYQFDLILSLLKKIGFTELYQFDHREKKGISIE